jgi:hypothetical protein
VYPWGYFSLLRGREQRNLRAAWITSQLGATESKGRSPAGHAFAGLSPAASLARPVHGRTGEFHRRSCRAAGALAEVYLPCTNCRPCFANSDSDRTAGRRPWASPRMRARSSASGSTGSIFQCATTAPSASLRTAFPRTGITYVIAVLTDDHQRLRMFGIVFLFEMVMCLFVGIQKAWPRHEKSSSRPG